MAWYCDAGCQKKHWPIHLVDCNLGRPITSTDRLIASVHSRAPPEDDTTRRDYGFMQMPLLDDQNRRLEVFQMLLEDPQIKAKALHGWMEAGNLSTMMREAFDARLPLRGRQKTLYNWFRKHQLTFGRDSDPSANNELSWLLEAKKKTWRYMGRDPSASLDTIVAALQSFSADELACFYLVTFLRAGMFPGPGMRLGPGMPSTWVYSGFCGCRNQHEEDSYADRFINLLDRVNYSTLYQAYVSSSFGKLFDDNGLGFDHPFVHDVLSSRNYKSVWFLKDFVCGDEEVAKDGEAHPSIGIDYGFNNCRNVDEVIALRNAYKHVLSRLDANPLALHEACLQGELFKHVQQLARLKPPQLFKRLMKNPYP